MLRRYVATDPAAVKALVAYTPADKGAEARQIFQGTGFVPVLVRDVKEAMTKLHESADYELIILHHTTPERELPYILTQLRQDSDAGLLPILIFTPSTHQERLLRIARRHKNVWILPDFVLTTPDQLKETLETHIKNASGAKLTAAERKEFPKVAMDILWRMARGEIAGYDVRPAQDAIFAALRSDDLAVEAIEILGRLPGADIQQRLAGIALDPARGKLRLTAAHELNRHIQKHGLVLGKVQINDVKIAHKNPAEDAALRAQLAMVVGSMRPSIQATGQRLLDFRPDPPPAPKNGKAP
jgi:CheY-like chemotaxis protein